MDRKLSGSIALTKLVHVKFTSAKGAKCILIPIEENFLETDDAGNIYLPVGVTVKDAADQYGQNGFISKQIGSKHYKGADQAKKDHWKANEKTITPILGSIKDFSGAAKNDNTGEVSSKIFDPTSEDLPF